ncbi:MAG: GNAT family N-acetyltransferase [Pseudomonadota bacterium]
MALIGAERRRRSTLETARLRLRPLRRDDSPVIERLAGEWEVARYLAQAPLPFPPGEAAPWIASLARSGEIALAIERRADRVFLGCCGCTVEADGVPDVGYWLGRPHWGQGYATEAVGRLVKHLFEDRGAARVTAAALPENPASIRVQERLGFIYAGAQEREFPARGGRRLLERRTLDRARWRELHDAR